MKLLQTAYQTIPEMNIVKSAILYLNSTGWEHPSEASRGLQDWQTLRRELEAFHCRSLYMSSKYERSILTFESECQNS